MGPHQYLSWSHGAFAPCSVLASGLTALTAAGLVEQSTSCWTRALCHRSHPVLKQCSLQTSVLWLGALSWLSGPALRCLPAPARTVSLAPLLFCWWWGEVELWG